MNRKNKPLHILYICTPSSIHDQKWIRYFSLQKEDHKVYLVYEKQNSLDKTMADRLRKENIQIIEPIDSFSVTSPLKTIQSILFLRKLVRTYNIDLVHILFATPFALWANFISVPYFITTRGSDVLIVLSELRERKSIQHLYSRMLFLLFARAFRRADQHICTSQAQAIRIRELFNTDRAIVIKTGIDVEQVAGSQRQDELNPVLKNRRFILSPRFFSQVYNIEVQLRAIENLPRKILDEYIFVFIRGKDYDARYAQMISSKLKQLQINLNVNYLIEDFLEQETLWVYYNYASLTLLTPLSDGTPSSALEAMAARCPLIIPDLAYDKDVLENTCVVYESARPEKLATVIESALESYPDGLLDTAFERVSVYGDRRKEMNRLGDLYKLHFVNKTLVLLSDNYPVSSGEFFIDDEMKVLKTRFNKIIVIQKESQAAPYAHYIPDNLTTYTYVDNYSLANYISGIRHCFRPFFIREIYNAKRIFHVPISMLLFKIMIKELIFGEKLKYEIKKILRKEGLKMKDVLFYSYWNDNKSFALSLVKRKNGGPLCLSRAHGWDIDYSRHPFPYLPFKTFVSSKLDAIYCISEQSKQTLLKLIPPDAAEKISVSRLGKINNHKPLIEKTGEGITICSCSSLIPLKRVCLIVDILSALKVPNVKWMHFGDGELRQELENYAKGKIPQVQYYFSGEILNADIMKFYTENYVDMFINVSETEGVPVSIMEALSAGIPVLATHVGGTAEVVNEQFGFLVQKNFCPPEAAAIIEEFLQSSSEEITAYRRNAYSFWKENYEANKNYQAFADSIQQL